MKIRSLLLGSVAAAGLATAGYATDLGVVTSLNVCDELGLSGLTISSDDNCLVITGGVTYEFKWGDYAGDFVLSRNFDRSNGDVTVMDSDTVWDHSSDLDVWLQFQATADSSFGPAVATIKLLAEDNQSYFSIDKAYVSIGDSTMLTAGLASTIYKDGDDEPLNFLGLFNSDDVNTGVDGYPDYVAKGGHVIQLVSDLGNGVWIGGGLENLNSSGTYAGTAVGVISYAGDGLTAHASFAGDGILNGTIEDWVTHAGFTGTWDNFKVVGAAALTDDGWWNVLGSASATFDMFTLAGSAEATVNGEFGVGASVGATVSDGVSINLGARYFRNDDWGQANADQDDVTQVAAQIVATVSEDVTVKGELGGYFSGAGSLDNPNASVYYVRGEAAWSPGGGVDATVAAQANSLGAWYTDFKISKSIK